MGVSIDNVVPHRVLIAADNPLSRTGLAALLSLHEQINVVGQVSPDAELSDAVNLYRPDVILWDFGYEPQVFYEHIAESRAAHVQIVALIGGTPHTAAAALPVLIGMGVHAVLSQAVNSDVLISAIHAVAHGLVVIGDSLAQQAFSQVVTLNDPADHTVEAFTPREREVLELVAEGLPNKSIARKLSISEHTVKFHLNAILTKLGAQSRTEAVVRATRLGMIAL
jgi:two-component system, NarL family, nitrate/nitrite response regulator NarL